jgi:hypothetical protein
MIPMKWATAGIAAIDPAMLPFRIARAFLADVAVQAVLTDEFDKDRSHVPRKSRFFSARPVLAAAGPALISWQDRQQTRTIASSRIGLQFPPGVTKWGAATGVATAHFM